MNKIHFLPLFTLLLLMLAAPSSFAADKTRVILIPLDDRPPCLQWPILMGPIAGAEIVTPPRDLLGRFMVGGDPEEIAKWFQTQDLNTFDAAIVSLDMVAYGGLVASRVHRIDQEKALERLEVLNKLRHSSPDLPIYGFNIIMRLAPTADGTNDAWRGALARWAELASQVDEDDTARDEVARLKERIPPEVLADYQKARARNLAVNRAAIHMIESGTLNYLILGQDDAKPQGVHVADRLALKAEVNATDTKDRIALQPGADEIAMLLLARILTGRAQVSPTIRAIYSSESSRTEVAPFEDRPLHETVSLQIAAAGARETIGDQADLHFYVFASRHEPDGEKIAKNFATKIAADVRAGARVIVADIDTRGNVQGGSKAFTEALRGHDVFPRLFGYASWNTAGNTIGTALPQGILRTLAADLRDKDKQTLENNAAHTAHLKFLLHRLVNDYVYHGRVRPDINRTYAPGQGMNPMRLSPDETALLETTLLERVSPMAEALWEEFRLAAESNSPSSHAARFSGLRLSLPWGRTFEAEIDFDFSTGKSRSERLDSPSHPSL